MTEPKRIKNPSEAALVVKYERNFQNAISILFIDWFFLVLMFNFFFMYLFILKENSLDKNVSNKKTVFGFTDVITAQLCVSGK